MSFAEIETSEFITHLNGLIQKQYDCDFNSLINELKSQTKDPFDEWVDLLLYLRSNARFVTSAKDKREMIRIMANCEFLGRKVVPFVLRQIKKTNAQEVWDEVFRREQTQCDGRPSLLDKMKDQYVKSIPKYKFIVVSKECEEDE